MGDHFNLIFIVIFFSISYISFDILPAYLTMFEKCFLYTFLIYLYSYCVDLSLTILFVFWRKASPCTMILSIYTLYSIHSHMFQKYFSLYMTTPFSSTYYYYLPNLHRTFELYKTINKTLAPLRSKLEKPFYSTIVYSYVKVSIINK